MALSDTQLNTIKDLKSKGYTEAQVLSFFGANEMGRSNSSIHKAEAQALSAKNKEIEQQQEQPMSNKFTNAVGLGGAVDTFGSLLARQGYGEQTKAQGQEFVDEPTGAQVAGAVAQTASIPAGAVLTGGGSLAGQMAAGAGLGYLYDVGGDYAEGKVGAENFKPGAETIAGMLVPPVLRGAGASIKGIGTLLSKGAQSVPTQSIPQVPAGTVGEVAGTVSDVADTASDLATPLRRAAREYAINRPSRLVQRAGEAMQESREMGKVYESAPAPV